MTNIDRISILPQQVIFYTLKYPYPHNGNDSYESLLSNCYLEHVSDVLLDQEMMYKTERDVIEFSWTQLERITSIMQCGGLPYHEDEYGNKYLECAESEKHMLIDNSSLSVSCNEAAIENGKAFLSCYNKNKPLIIAVPKEHIYIIIYKPYIRLELVCNQESDIRYIFTIHALIDENRPKGDWFGRIYIPEQS